jgi:hypothetical protein
MEPIKWYHCGKLLNGANFCPNCGVARPALDEKECRAVKTATLYFNKAKASLTNYNTHKSGRYCNNAYNVSMQIAGKQIAVNHTLAATYLKSAVKNAALALLALDRVPNIPLMYGQLPMEMLKALPDFCEV